MRVPFTKKCTTVNFLPFLAGSTLHHVVHTIRAECIAWRENSVILKAVRYEKKVKWVSPVAKLTRICFHWCVVIAYLRSNAVWGLLCNILLRVELRMDRRAAGEIMMWAKIYIFLFTLSYAALICDMQDGKVKRKSEMKQREHTHTS